MLFEPDIKPKGVIHIGAHTGEELPIYLGWNTKRIWIEAQGELVEALRAKGEIVFRAYISNENGTADFHLSSNAASSSLLEYGTHAEQYPDIKILKTHTVETITLDALIRAAALKMEKFNMLNIDIEGMGLAALQGMTDHIKYIDYIYMEVYETELYKGCGLLPEVDEFLTKFNFKRTRTEMLARGFGDALYIRQ